MHILIAVLYACVVFLFVLACVVIADGPLIVFLAISPLIVSGVVIGIMAIDFAVRGLIWLGLRMARAVN